VSPTTATMATVLALDRDGLVSGAVPMPGSHTRRALDLGVVIGFFRLTTLEMAVAVFLACCRAVFCRDTHAATTFSFGVVVKRRYICRTSCFGL